jgi:ribosomal protein S8
MKNIDVSKLRNDIIEGMRLSSEKLKALKKQLGRTIVISENGVIKEIEAKDLK